MALRRIAYVEDENDLREIVGAVLTEMGGFEVYTFSSGDEALKHLPELQPDFILLDIVMPGMTGHELRARLAEDPSTSSIPVAFLTANSIPILAREISGEPVIAKPFDPGQLCDDIRVFHAAATQSQMIQLCPRRAP